MQNSFAAIQRESIDNNNFRQYSIDERNISIFVVFFNVSRFMHNVIHANITEYCLCSGLTALWRYINFVLLLLLLLLMKFCISRRCGGKYCNGFV